MIGDRSQITYLELFKLLDDDETFAREALEILFRDHARPSATYTVATSATALLSKWVERGELRCYNERGHVVTDFNAQLYRGEDDYQTALESVESGWLIDRAAFVQLVDRYGMRIPEAVAYKPRPDFTMLPDRFGYTVDGAAHALSEQCDANEEKWRTRIFEAVLKGELRVRDPSDGAYFKPERPCKWIERIAIADLNTWLKQSGTTFQIDEWSDPSTMDSSERPKGVSRTRIIDGFPVKPEPQQNRGYCDDKLSKPPGWLIEARVWKGRAGVSSQWNPASVAHALLGHGDMPLPLLDRAMANFPDWDHEWRQQTENDRP